MIFYSFLLLALTVSVFGIPGSAPNVPSTAPSNDPCAPNSGHHRVRRSLPRSSLERRQFIGVQYIPGQGTQAPKPSSQPAAPGAKYVISEALIQQNNLNINRTNQQLLERIEVLVANVSTPSERVKCSIDWNSLDAGNAKLGYQFKCDDDAFCVILQQASPQPERGFYIYVSLPNALNTQVAWQVKDLSSSPGWTAMSLADTSNTEYWGNWHFNGTAPLSQEPTKPLASFTGP